MFLENITNKMTKTLWGNLMNKIEDQISNNDVGEELNASNNGE